MTKSERVVRKSLVARRRETTEGQLGLTAARLSLQVVGILNRARDEASKKNAQLAAALGVTEGRVSQVLNGDGNVHVATLARFLWACGYELELVARPIAGGLPEIGKLTKRVGRRSENDTGPKAWEFFEQVYATPAGVLSQVAVVSRNPAEPCPVPLGEPKHVGTLSSHVRGRMDVTFMSGLWDTDVENASVLEDADGVIVK